VQAIIFILKSPIIIRIKTSQRQYRIRHLKIQRACLGYQKPELPLPFPLLFFSIFLEKYFWTPSTLPFYQPRSSSLFHTGNTLVTCHTPIRSGLVLESKEFPIAQKFARFISSHTQILMFA